MNNIDIFKALSALALAKCYDSFPLKVEISPSKLASQLGDEYWCSSLEEIDKTASRYIRNRNPASIAKPTIEWMVSSGLITCEKYYDHSFHGVCLTVKGLEAIESKQTRGTELLDAAKNLAKDELKSQARDALKKVFTEVLSWSIEKSPTIIHTITNYASQ